MLSTVKVESMAGNESGIERAFATHLGRYLRELREASQLTQEQLALRAGMNRNHYQLIEHGFANEKTKSPANPHLSTLLALAQALNTTAHDILATVHERARHTPEGQSVPIILPPQVTKRKYPQS